MYYICHTVVPTGQAETNFFLFDSVLHQCHIRATLATEALMRDAAVIPIFERDLILKGLALVPMCPPQSSASDGDSKAGAPVSTIPVRSRQPRRFSPKVRVNGHE